MKEGRRRGWEEEKRRKDERRDGQKIRGKELWKEFMKERGNKGRKVGQREEEEEKLILG